MSCCGELWFRRAGQQQRAAAPVVRDNNTRHGDCHQHNAVHNYRSCAPRRQGNVQRNQQDGENFRRRQNGRCLNVTFYTPSSGTDVA